MTIDGITTPVNGRTVLVSGLTMRKWREDTENSLKQASTDKERLALLTKFYKNICDLLDMKLSSSKSGDDK